MPHRGNSKKRKRLDANRLSDYQESTCGTGIAEAQESAPLSGQAFFSESTEGSDLREDAARSAGPAYDRRVKDAGRAGALSNFGNDMTNFVRRNPLPILLVGFALGFLVARVTRS